jgi:hypothetical protein
LDSGSLTLSVTALANFLSENLSDSEIAITAAVFTQLGDTLATILAQRALCAAPLGEAVPLTKGQKS